MIEFLKKNIFFSSIPKDPAGPGFQRAAPNARLNFENAQYVQCIYTDGNTWGTDIESGDGFGNFFMNGGRNQPGCIQDVGATCDHSRAIEYFKESMDENHVFEGAMDLPLYYLDDNGEVDESIGSDRDDFSDKSENKDRICRLNYGEDLIDRIGIHSKEETGNFCVNVAKNPPYALGLLSKQ